MRQVFETTGTITSLSGESGEVDITTTVGVRSSLTFRASNFHAFGIPCDGVLTDFLEKGMQVNVCYNVHRFNLQILAVWQGDKPNILDCPLYNREGRILLVGSDYIVVQTNSNNPFILISKDVVFCDGYPLKDSSAAVNAGDFLRFDAVPIKSHTSPFGYLATCAWFGLNGPRLLDRFRHCLYADPNEKYLEVDNVVGRVAVIPTDNVALVDVETFNCGKVIMPKETFHPSCVSLKYAVVLGGMVIMRLLFGRYFSDKEMWFAVATSKHPGVQCGEVTLKIIKCKESVDPDNVSDICLKEEDGVQAEEIGVKRKSEGDLKYDSERASKVACLNSVPASLSQDTHIIPVPEDTVEKVGCCDGPSPIPDSVAVHQDSSTKPPVAKNIDIEEEQEELAIVFERSQKTACSVPLTNVPSKNLNSPRKSLISPRKNLNSPPKSLNSPHKNLNSPPKNLVGTKIQVIKDAIEKKDFEDGTGGPSKVLCSDNAVESPDSTTDIHEHRHTGNEKKQEERVELKDSPVREVLPFFWKPPNNEIDTEALTEEDSEEELEDDLETSKVLVPSLEVIKVQNSRKTSAEAVASVLNDKEDTKETNSKELLKSYPESKAPFGRVYRGVSFQKSSPSGNRSFLLDWTGIVSINDDHQDVKFLPLVETSFGKVSLKVDDVVVYGMNNTKPVTKETLMVNGRNVCFDADRISYSVTDDFQVQRMWFRHSIRPSPELLLPRLKYSGPVTFDRAAHYRGKIVSFPFHDCAIATVDEVSVLVKLDSLVIDQDYNECWSTIDMFLNVGSTVFLKIVEKHTGEEKYFEAEKCWNEIICRENDPQKENVTWFNVWGKGKFSEQGTISLKDGYVGVNFGSPKSIDARKCIFFNDGVLSNLSELAALVGNKITCDVAHDQGEEFVACAWIGNKPPASTILKNRLAVPKGLVKESKVYEGVVEDFTLPGHVVCKIGVVPVLRALTPVKINKTFAGVVERDLKTGQRVFLNVKEKNIQNKTFIVCTYVVGDDCNDDEKVLVNFPGHIVKEPKYSGSHSGLIEANGGFKVSFEMCCVKNMSDGKGDIFSWSKLIRSKARVGAKVHFSAKKGIVPEKPLYAYEVWIDNL